MGIVIQDVEDVLGQDREQLPGDYSDRDTLLYAVAIGLGRDPLDPNELPYVCETSGQKVVPTVASVLSRPSKPGIHSPLDFFKKMNMHLMLHGEQRLQVHQPLPSKAKTLISTYITGVYDKGESKGTLVTMDTDVKLEDGSNLFTIGMTAFFRGDGGFGGSSEGAPTPHPIPDRKPDAVCEMPGRDDQALIYALCGDRNPLHRDPEFAKKAGFDKPIIHGLCSYGIACHAVLKTMLDYDHEAITGFDVRFSSPAYPGETQVVEMWQDDKVISFRTTIKERGVVVINNGKCTIR
jgi:acyl dehydratase